MSQVVLQVPEVHCDHCKSSIEGAVATLPGVKSVEVAIGDATVAVDFDESKSDLTRIKETIEEQGYVVFG
jgi:copper chaperone